MCGKIQTSHTLLGCCAKEPVLPEQTHDTKAAVRGSHVLDVTHVGLCIYCYFSFLSHVSHCSVQDQVLSKLRLDTSVSSWNPSNSTKTYLLPYSLQDQAINLWWQRHLQNPLNHSQGDNSILTIPHRNFTAL